MIRITRIMLAVTVSIPLNGFITYNLDDNLVDQSGLANRNAVNTVQIDLNFKF